MHWMHHVCRLPVRTCNVFLIFLPCASYVFGSSPCVSYHHDVPSNPRTTLEYFSHSKMKRFSCCSLLPRFRVVSPPRPYPTRSFLIHRNLLACPRGQICPGRRAQWSNCVWQADDNVVGSCDFTSSPAHLQRMQEPVDRTHAYLFSRPSTSLRTTLLLCYIFRQYRHRHEHTCLREELDQSVSARLIIRRSFVPCCSPF
ncbi:hypothetical protein F4604DRAFT_107932 [Suillus subluteus]|nr:hypothetical protein F4604DRAFT_107932 [Suillus subluteus]